MAEDALLSQEVANFAKRTPSPEIIETDIGPVISGRRVTVYDALCALDCGDNRSRGEARGTARSLRNGTLPLKRRCQVQIILTIRHLVTPESLPVLTISNLKRINSDPVYRKRCAEQMAEIVDDIERYRGTMRLFLSS